MRVIVYPSKLVGEQIAPASKSSMQRACAAALLRKGQTIIHNPGHSNDDLAAMVILKDWNLPKGTQLKRIVQQCKSLTTSILVCVNSLLSKS